MTIMFDNSCEASFDFAKDEKLLIDQLEIATQCVCDYFEFPYEVEVSVSVVDKDEIKTINNQFRQIDRVTDVLSFPMMNYDSPADFDGLMFKESLSVNEETGEVILGDIVLCADVIIEQAKEYGHSQEREFVFLVVHSLLHLLGFDHMEDEERVEMEEKQRIIMDILKINR